MSQRFKEVLNDSLDRILIRGETIEQVLSYYPQHAGELKALLKAALLASQSAKSQPRAEFKKEARAAFINAASRARPLPLPKSFFHWRWHKGWALAASVFLAFIVAAASSVAASANSMPDQRLYPVKLASEQAYIAVTPSPMAKAKLEAKFAARRAEELSYIAVTDGPEAAEQLSNQLSGHLTKIEELVQREADKAAYGIPTEKIPAGKNVIKLQGKKAEELRELRKILAENRIKHEKRVMEVEARVSLNTKPRVRLAIEKSRQAYQKAIVATGEDD